jgi:hypothetical protein
MPFRFCNTAPNGGAGQPNREYPLFAEVNASLVLRFTPGKTKRLELRLAKEAAQATRGT